MSQDSARQPESVRRINAKLTALKKEFHASTGLAIGSLADTMTAILGDIGNEMMAMQARLDTANTEVERLRKFEPKKKEPPKKPEPEPPVPPKTKKK